MRENRHDRVSRGVRLIACALLGALVGGVAAVWVSTAPAVLVGWDVAAALYVAWAIAATFRLTAAATQERASTEDPGRAGFDILLIAASVASLAAVALVVISDGSSTVKDMSALLAVVSVVVGWCLLHTVFFERYARLYYADIEGGINFNQQEPPDYRDFAYLAFTVGMTYQVSDTALTDRRIRHAVLRHALLSYLFGAVIIASTINLLVSLAK
jgi:uncharacterized membrane protein